MVNVEGMEVTRMSVMWHRLINSREYTVWVFEHITHTLTVGIDSGATRIFMQNYEANTPITTIVNDINGMVPGIITKQKLQCMILIDTD